MVVNSGASESLVTWDNAEKLAQRLSNADRWSPGAQACCAPAKNRGDPQALLAARQEDVFSRIEQYYAALP
jgi:hypothetical protein